MRLFIFIITLSFVPVFSFSQNFSCLSGADGACLGFGEKVCSSQGKCVSSDAMCFDVYTCGYGYNNGIVCKKDYDSLVGEYDSLINQYNNHC
jgi:hypothetical protein